MGIDSNPFIFVFLSTICISIRIRHKRSSDFNSNPPQQDAFTTSATTHFCSVESILMRVSLIASWQIGVQNAFFVVLMSFFCLFFAMDCSVMLCCYVEGKILSC
eukprot:701401_1